MRKNKEPMSILSDNYDKMEVFIVTGKLETSKVNRATPKTEQGVWRVEDHTEGDECVEELQFAMKDKYHEFSLGLSVVLECLVVAEKEGFVPPLPENWWIQLRQVER